jgi:hypothetical protein
MTTISTIPLPISSYIGDFVALRRRRRAWTAMGRSVAFVLGFALVCGLIDRLAPLPPSLRVGLLSVSILVAAILLARPVRALLLKRVDWLEASDDIEQREEGFAERLQTVASQHLIEPEYRGSPQIVGRLGEEVMALLRGAAPGVLLPLGPVLRPWAMSIGLAGVMGLLWLVPVIDMPRLMARFFAPWLDIRPATTTQLRVSPGDADVLEGQAVTVSVVAERLGGGAVVLHYEKQGVETQMVLPRTPAGAVEGEIGPLERDTRYFVTGGDARSDPYTIRVLRRPVVSEFRIRYSYPASTGRESLTVSNTDGLIEAPVGTDAVMTVVATEPLASAELVLPDRTIPLAATAEANVWMASMRVERDAIYALKMSSLRGIAGSHEGGVIRAIPDSPPLVTLNRPPADLRLHPRDILSLPYQAMDDYGLTGLAMRIEVLSAGGGGVAQNLALGRPVIQSSTWGEHEAARAVDGNTDGNLQAGSVTHTNNEPQNWWQVDLGTIRPLSVIELYNRTDAAPERLREYDVLVSNEAMEGAEIELLKARSDVSVFHQAEQAGSPTGVDVYRDGRYVRVHLPRQEFLSLAEVRVFEARPVASADSSGARQSRGPTDTRLAIRGDSRRQDADLRLDLATLNVGIGDVVMLSVVATDTAGQTGASEPCRIIVSPRSIDLNTFERIAELRAADQFARSVTNELEGAVRVADQANPRNQPNQDAYLSALAEVTRRLTAANDSAERLVPALLRATARSESPDLSDALANYNDQVQTAAVVARDVNEQFGLGEFPSDDARQDLQRALDESRRTQQELGVISQGEQAKAILADIDNLKATRNAGPYPDRESADLARQRSERVRDEIAQGVREIGIDPHAPDLEPQLQQRVQAAENLARSRRRPDFEQPAREFAEDLKRDPQRELPLDERLHTAAQAEAVRPDADMERARDLMLASSAVAQIQEGAERQQEQPADAGKESAKPPSGDELGEAVKAVQREHEMNRRPTDQVSPKERRETGERAEQARQQLAEWAQEQAGGEHAAGEHAPPESGASSESEQQAMEANAEMAPSKAGSHAAEDQPAGQSESAAHPPGQEEQDGRMEQLRADVEQASDEARDLDELIAQQRALRDRTAKADRGEADELAEDQGALAQRVGRLADAHDGIELPFSEVADEDPDSRIRAANAIANAQEQLAAMPQVLNLARRAAALWWRTQDMEQEARRQAEHAPPEEQAIALRVAASAKAQALEAEGRLRGVSEPVQPQAAAAMAVSLAPFTPETAEAVQSIGSRLAPALMSLDRAVQSRDESAADRAIADARKAIERVQNDLNEAQDHLMDRDPLASAKAFAESASRSLSRHEPDMSAAEHSQSTAAEAMQRASDQAIHQAARARLSQLPAMGAVLLPMGASRGQSQGSAQGDGSGRIPLLRNWGRLQARTPDQINIAPTESAPPGYQDALKAYFEALGKVNGQAGATP